MIKTCLPMIFREKSGLSITLKINSLIKELGKITLLGLTIGICLTIGVCINRLHSRQRINCMHYVEEQIILLFLKEL